MTDTDMTDPASRLTPEFVTRLERRYEQAKPIIVPDEEHIEIYARLCDVACQVMWPDQYGISPDDKWMSSSAPARAFAWIAMAAAGIRSNEWPPWKDSA